jgi:predicted transcriptional regulator
MTKPLHIDLSRREREIMDIVFRLGEAGVADVLQHMHDDPGYDSVRVTLGILKRKGHLKSQREGRRYLYSPTVTRDTATKSALGNLVQTFFEGSPSKAILTLIDMSSDRLSEEELGEIAAMIEKGKDT